MIGGKHCFASCWKIQREDGVEHTFTDHDNEVEVDGDSYVPGGTGTVSARQRIEGIDPQNADIRGAVSGDFITEEDLRAGRYRNAKVTEFVVDWRFPFAGKFSVNVYYVEEATFDGEKWTAKLLGQKIRLRPKVGSTYTRDCRYDLGDADCGVDLGAITVSGTVSAVVTGRRVFQTDLTESDDYFNSGQLTFTSGSNVGLSMDVKSYLNATGLVELQVNAPFQVSPGDQFDVYPGCDRSAETCKVKFNNLLRFGGYPTIPGNDKALNTPDVKGP